MPKAETGYVVRRIANDLRSLLSMQRDQIAIALKAAIESNDEAALITAVTNALMQNADMAQVATLLQAGEAAEAEALCQKLIRAYEKRSGA